MQKSNNLNNKIKQININFQNANIGDQNSINFI